MRAVICVLLTIFCSAGAQSETCPLPSSNLTLYASEDWQDLKSPTYGFEDNILCMWTIRSPDSSKRIVLVVDSLDLETSGSSGCYDYIEISDDYNFTGKYCRPGVPRITSRRQTLYVTFKGNLTTGTRLGNGFHLRYRLINATDSTDSVVPTQTCSQLGITLQAQSYPKYITSLHYPANYPNNIYCQWTIETLTANYVVKIVVEDSDLEASINCFKDYLSAYDGSRLSDTPLIKWCSTLKPIIYSSGFSLTLMFSSEYSGSGRGFKLSYQEVPGINSSMPIQICLSGGINLQAQSTPKYITSENYPENYPPGRNCVWTIKTSTANHVVKIVVEDSHLDDSEYCTWGNLAAYDGSKEWGTQLDMWCGTKKPTIYSSGSYLTLELFSYSSDDSGRRFKLSYQEVPESERVPERVPERVRGLSTGAIIGIIVGVVAGLILLSICICCCCCAQRNKPTATAGTAAAMTSRGVGGTATSAHVTMTTAGSQDFFTTSTFRPNSGQMTTNQYAAAYDLPPYPGPAQCSSLLAFAAPMGISYPQSNAPAGYPAQVPTSTAGSADYNRQESLPSEPSPPYWMADQYEVQPAQRPTLDTSGAGGQSQPSSAAAASSTATVPAPGADTQQRAQGSAPPAAPRSGQAAPGGSDNRAFVPDEA